MRPHGFASSLLVLMLALVGCSGEPEQRPGAVADGDAARSRSEDADRNKPRSSSHEGKGRKGTKLDRKRPRRSGAGDRATRSRSGDRERPEDGGQRNPRAAPAQATASRSDPSGDPERQGE